MDLHRSVHEEEKSKLTLETERNKSEERVPLHSDVARYEKKTKTEREAVSQPARPSRYSNALKKKQIQLDSTGGSLENDTSGSMNRSKIEETKQNPVTPTAKINRRKLRDSIFHDILSRSNDQK